MPLVGLVDPSHSERRRDKPGRLPTWIPVEELLAESLRQGTKWSSWTYEMIQAALTEHQERGDRISTTTLVAACPRGTVLERKADYIGDLDSMYASLRGTMIHRTLEYEARPGSVAEGRFFTTLYGGKGVGDLEVSGSPDLVTGPPEATLYDFKTTDSPPTYDYPWAEHAEQVQLNRFIVNNAAKWELGEGQVLPWNPRELVIKHLVLVYLGPKWPKPLEVTVSVPWTTPSGATKKVKQPNIWTDERVREEFEPKLHWMARALNEYPVFPKGAELLWGGEADWRCPGKPLCQLPNCVAKRFPNGLIWPSPKN
jgi:hypothetical protein